MGSEVPGTGAAFPKGTETACHGAWVQARCRQQRGPAQLCWDPASTRSGGWCVHGGAASSHREGVQGCGAGSAHTRECNPVGLRESKWPEPPGEEDAVTSR